jgi:Wiskott-Aldrich syndrome protein
MTRLTCATEPDPGTQIPPEMPPPVMPPVPDAPPEIHEPQPTEPTLPVREPGRVIPAQVIRA